MVWPSIPVSSCTSCKCYLPGKCRIVLDNKRFTIEQTSRLTLWKSLTIWSLCRNQKKFQKSPIVDFAGWVWCHHVSCMGSRRQNMSAGCASAGCVSAGCASAGCASAPGSFRGQNWNKVMLLHHQPGTSSAFTDRSILDHRGEERSAHSVHLWLLNWWVILLTELLDSVSCSASCALVSWLQLVEPSTFHQRHE